MPMRVRIALTSTPGAVMSTPSTMIRPASIGSRRFTHRSNVDLPDPDAPIRQITSCSSTIKSIPRRTSSLSNDFRTPSSRIASLIACSPPAAAGGPARSTSR